MERIRTPAAMRAWADARREEGARIGLVPTMGYLHEGHVSLVRVAKGADCTAVAASIFVNPTQFGPGEDFEKYPRDEARDLAMLDAAGVDAVYLPGVMDMYPERHQTFVEVTGVSQGLCGAARPGHFRGVATVVAKLFLAAKPHVAVFGEKDCQQLAVIRAMNRDLDFGIEIVGAPIVREADGLAMSSRNAYLKGGDRIAARCLSRGLFRAKELFGKGERDGVTLVAAARAAIEGEPLAGLEYAEGRDPVTLTPLSGRVGAVTILVAAKVGPARLIDNITLGKYPWEGRIMMKTMLKCKIHRATVTDAVLHYEGSVTIDRTLMTAAGLVEYEEVHIWNVDNGNRFTTYAIQGEADSGVICLNGAAARQVSKGDLVIIASFSAYDEKELAHFQPTLVYVDRKNRITSVKRKIESESQRPRVAAAV